MIDNRRPLIFCPAASELFLPRNACSHALTTMLLLLISNVVHAQDVNSLKSSVVRVRNTYNQDVGTGFIIKIDGDRAYVLTAAHVVKNNEHPGVYLYNQQNQAVQATLTYREDDEQKGLALLEVKAKRETFANLAPVQLRLSHDLKGGEQVQVIGFPDGIEIWTVSSGNVSRLEARNLVFSAPIRKGNSGSPVFYNGFVIGLVTDADPNSVYAVRTEGIMEYLGGINDKLAEAVKPRAAPAVNPTDNSEFCRALTRIVDSSRNGFYDITKGVYESTVRIPGFRSEMVSPETHRATFYNFTSDSFKARNQYYELVANTKRCLPDWKQIDPRKFDQLRVQLDAPTLLLFFGRDETLVAIEHKKVTDDYKVEMSIHGANGNGKLWFLLGDEVPLALGFTDTDADKEIVCQNLKTLVNASQQAFTSIVGKPGFASGYFEASIKITGFPSIQVNRREKAYISFDAKELSAVEALNDRLIGILTTCFPTWKGTEIQGKSPWDQTTRRFRLSENNEAGPVFELSYDFDNNRRSGRLMLELYAPGAAPKLR
jgi:hypothetical protein